MMRSNHFGEWFCGSGSFFSGFPFGGIFNLLLWGLALFFLYKLARTFMADNTAANNSESLSILEKRYASGEINQDEFLKRKSDLGY